VPLDWPEKGRRERGVSKGVSGDVEGCREGEW